MASLVGLTRPDPDPLQRAVDLAESVSAMVEDRLDRSSGTRRIEYKSLLGAIGATRAVLAVHVDQRLYMESNELADHIAFDLLPPLSAIGTNLDVLRHTLAKEEVSLALVSGLLKEAERLLTVMRDRFYVTTGVDEAERAVIIARADVYELEAADSSSDLASMAEFNRIEAESAAGGTADRVLGADFAGRAREERRIGNVLRGIALAVIAAAIVLSYLYSRASSEPSWSTLALKLSVGLPIAAMIVFLIQESRSHLREATHLQLLSLQLGTIAAYCGRMPPAEATEVLTSFGLSVYRARPLTETGEESDLSGQLGDVLDTAERISKLVPRPIGS